MSDINTGLQLMLVGMVTVFLILLIVIYGSRLLIKLINRIAPAEEAPVKSRAASDAVDTVKPVLEAAVAQITGGKGHIVKITKL